MSSINARGFDANKTQELKAVYGTIQYCLKMCNISTVDWNTYLSQRVFEYRSTVLSWLKRDEEEGGKLNFLQFCLRRRQYKGHLIRTIWFIFNTSDNLKYIYCFTTIHDNLPWFLHSWMSVVVYKPLASFVQHHNG